MTEYYLLKDRPVTESLKLTRVWNTCWIYSRWL